MQRFILLHDGSAQGWQAAYLAFHVAAQLGASLLVLLIDSTTEKKDLVHMATQVEVGGRAAGVSISTRSVPDFSAEIVAENVAQSDGIFVPRRLTKDDETILHLMKTLPSPLWIVTNESQMRKMAVLVDDFVTNESLVNYTTALSRRMQQSLTLLIRENAPASTGKADTSIVKISLPAFSPANLEPIFSRLGVNLLFIPASRLDLVKDLSINCVVYPLT